MPIYEYECGDCGHRLEVLQRISDERLTTCAACGKEALKKLVSPVGFQLKGTGWYETDFKNKGKAPAAQGSDKGSGKSESGKGDGAADSKSTGSDAGSDTKKSADKSAD